MEKLLGLIFLFLFFASCTKDEPARPKENCLDQSLKKPVENCSGVRSLVCGCDGITYLNECEAKKAGVATVKKGPCNMHPCIDTSKIGPRVCFMVFDPVCGCDGITYGNYCEARAAGVTSYLKGECGKAYCIDSARISPDRVCPADSLPVCGCDGVTYRNGCEASKKGVAAFIPGACN